jgi:lipoprotein-anchoring transpeptidase ErfK/SrfK
MPDPARRSGVQAGDRLIDTQLEDRVNKVVAALASIPAMLLLGSNAPPPLPDRAPAPAVVLAQSAALPAGPTAAVQPTEAFAPAIPAIAEPVEPPPPPPPLPPTPEEARQDGVLIVVSLASQRMYVFRDGALWDSSKVSTGKRGNETPVGTFPILQKKVHHRSNLYNDAPMPYMQRLTWGGVALHPAAQVVRQEALRHHRLLLHAGGRHRGAAGFRRGCACGSLTRIERLRRAR